MRTPTQDYIHMQRKPQAGAYSVPLSLQIFTSEIITMQNNFATYLPGPE